MLGQCNVNNNYTHFEQVDDRPIPVIVQQFNLRKIGIQIRFLCKVRVKSMKKEGELLYSEK